jgi:hypothetical protein
MLVACLAILEKLAVQGGRLFGGCQGDDQRSEIFGSDIDARNALGKPAPRLIENAFRKP